LHGVERLDGSEDVKRMRSSTATAYLGISLEGQIKTKETSIRVFGGATEDE
jgi:hypothetical protein